MVQGSIKKGFQKAFSRREDIKDSGDSGKTFDDLTVCLRIKWKLIISTITLLASIFIFSGLIIYINLQSTQYCRRGRLNVHLVPYMISYLDPYSTPEEYVKNDLRQSLDLVVKELMYDKRRRYTLTEVHALWDWWKEQSDEMKLTVRNLLNEGQLEIAGGAWCIADEAVVNYRTFIDIFTLGMRRLMEISNLTNPKVALLIDNKGHSSGAATLMKAMDFEALILGGISLKEKCIRRTYHSMEFIWNNDEGIDRKPKMFTSIVDDELITFDNLLKLGNSLVDIQEFLKVVVQEANIYETYNIFLPIVAPFPRKNFNQTFRVIDRVITLTENYTKKSIDIFYSTPSQYIKCLAHYTNRWPKSYAEFLPYSQNRAEYWTGYYTSKPSLKYLGRLVNEFLQVFKQVLVLSNIEINFNNSLYNLQQAVALSQHHVGMTGVLNSNMVNYFSGSLHRSFVNASDAVGKSLNKIITKNGQLPELNYQSCLMLNISKCDVSENSKNFIVTVYNPLGYDVDQYIRIPVTQTNYLVRNAAGESLPIQVLNISSLILMLPGRESEAQKEIVFRAGSIPALGFKSYYISATDATFRENNIHYEAFHENFTNDGLPFGACCSNEITKNINLIFNDRTGKLQAIQGKENKIYQLSQDIKFYTSLFPRNAIFKPIRDAELISSRVRTRLLNDGELVTEYEQRFASWASQIIRVYKDEDFIEFKWIIGPTPLSFSLIDGKEVISSFTTNIKHGGSFYVDVNGRGLKKKYLEMDFQSVGEYITKNYHAVNSHIAIADLYNQLHIFNDRSQGGASLFQGELELMVDRGWLTIDDLRRIDDINVNDYNTELVATGVHWVFLGGSGDLSLQDSVEDFAARNNWHTWYFFADASKISFEDWRLNHVTEFSGLKTSLPRNIRILTLEPWGPNQLLLRLENIGTPGGIQLSVNLKELFRGLTVTNSTEVPLSGFGCYKQERSNFGKNPFLREELSAFHVSISPSEIKTFILDFKYSR